VKAVVAFLFLALNFYTYHYFASEEEHPARQSLERFPDQIGDWRCMDREKMAPEVEKNLGATDYVICTYVNPAYPMPVNLYIGYHASQVNQAGGGGGETRIHPPAHCLPGAGWNIIASQDEAVTFAGLPQSPADAKRIVIAKGDSRQLVFYWYQERGRVIADDWMKIVYLFWDRARAHRTDGALVRFTAPIARGDDATTEAALRDLAQQITPKIPAYVPN
jgi:EpsI family protein